LAGQPGGPGVDVERLVASMLGDAEPAAGVDLADGTPRRLQGADHLRDAAQGLFEDREAIREVAVAHVEMDGVDDEAVARGDREGLVQVVGKDAELRGLGAGVEGLARARVRGADAGIDADPDARARRAAADAVDLG